MKAECRSMALRLRLAPAKIFLWIFILCVVDTAENDRNGKYLFDFFLSFFFFFLFLFFSVDDFKGGNSCWMVREERGAW